MEVTFNRREHTRDSGVFLLVAAAPARLEGVIPSAVPARDAAAAAAVVAVVAGRNVGGDVRLAEFGTFGTFGFGFASIGSVGAFAAVRLGGVSAVDASHVALFSAPRVDASDPSAGPASGGTLVVVVGADFRRLVDEEYPAAAAVEFGDVAAVALRAVSSALAFAETPASGYDVASIRVAASGASAASAAAPSFAPRPTMSVESTSPSRGPDEGGSLVAARGTNLGGAAPLWCRFGTVGPIAARRAVVDGDAAATEARCLSPAGARRVVRLAVSDNRRDWSASGDDVSDGDGDGDHDQNQNHAAAAASAATSFAFVTPARAFAVMPPAAVAGGGGVFAPGRGVSVFFQSATTALARGVSGCGYGGTSSRGAVVADAHAPARARTRVECLTAPDPFIEGFFPVLVEGPDAGGLGHGFGFGGAAPEFEYVAAPQIAAWQPDVAHVDGGALARITGADFLGGGGGGGGDFSSAASFASLTCVFAAGPRIGGAVSGYAPSTRVAVAVSSALVVCETPSGLPEGIAALGVGLAGSAGMASSGAAAPLAIVPAPTVSDMSPTLGAADGGVVVALSGRRAHPASGGDDLAARVGSIAPVALRPGAGAGSAEFIAPARASGRAVVLVARSPADAFAVAPTTFAYRSAFVAAAASPAAVSAAAGGRIRVFAASGALPPSLASLAPDVARDEDTALGVDGSGGGAQLRAGGPRGDRVNEATTTLAPGTPAGFRVVDVFNRPGPGGRERGVSSAMAAANVLVSMPQVERRVSATIRWVHPRVSAPGGGGTVVDVVGANFVVGETATRLGEFAAATPGTSTVVVSSALIRLEATGAHHHDTRAPVEVSSSRDPSDAASWSSDGTLVAFHRVPSSHRAEPDFGGEEGGAACLLTGRDYRDGGSQLRCRFGAVVVTASAFFSVNKVECVSPARAPDALRPAGLAVAVNGRDFSDEFSSRRAKLEFTYGPRLEVYGLDPNRGPGTGGTEVTVHGANFLPTVAHGAATRSFSCRFDHYVVQASRAGDRATTANTAVCRSPPHHVGFVAVEVSAGPGNFTSFGVMFEYQAAAAPEVVFPPAGVVGGGTLVTVAGANFVASGQHWSYGHGNVAQPGSGGGMLVGSTSDPSAGVDALQCRFGGAYVTGATAISSALIRCETPTFSDAAVDRALATDVSINAGEDYAGAQTYFEPIAEAFVLSLEPRAGTCGGGTVVNVYGVGFTVDEPVWCKFGTTGPIPAEYASEGMVQCKSPAKAAMNVPLEVSRGNTFDMTRNSVMFSI